MVHFSSPRPVRMRDDYSPGQSGGSLTDLAASAKLRPMTVHRDPRRQERGALTPREDRDSVVAEDEVNEVVERLVRADVGRLLHNEYPGKAICIDCLAAAIPAGSLRSHASRSVGRFGR